MANNEASPSRLVTLLPAVSATGAGGSFDLGDMRDEFSLLVATTGSPTFSVTFQGSEDGTNWFTLGTAVTSVTNGTTVTGVLARYVRANLTALSGGTLTAELAFSLALGRSAQAPAGSTTVAGTLQLDGTAAHILPAGTQGAGGNTLAADSGHVHPAQGWTLADNGLLAAAYDLHSATATQVMTAGNLYLVKIPVRQPITATFVWWDISGAGSGTSTGTFTGLYAGSAFGSFTAGQLMSGSADIAASLAAGPAKLTLTTPQAIPAGVFVWAALLVNFGTTQPTPFRSVPGTFANLNLTPANYAAATNGSSLTSLPGSITPSSNSQGAAQYYWAGLT